MFFTDEQEQSLKQIVAFTRDFPQSIVNSIKENEHLARRLIRLLNDYPTIPWDQRTKKNTAGHGLNTNSKQ